MFLLLQVNCFAGFVEAAEMIVLPNNTGGLEGGRMI